MVFEIRVDFGLISGVICALILFGVEYNHLVDWLQRKHYTEGYLSLIVAAGVFVTLLGVGILSWQVALLVLAFFAASGLPMILGSIIRYSQKRSREIEAIKRGVYGDEGEGMAK